MHSNVEPEPRSGLQRNQSIDFRRSLPPVPHGLHEHFTRAFDALARERDLGQLTHQSIPRGAEQDREAAARFLAPRFGSVNLLPRLIITNGTQSALLILLKRLVGVGGVLLAERLTYGPLRLLAEVAGVRAVGLDIDEEGILPDSFEAACRSLRPGALYCNPTVQNPTTAIMPKERRAAIAQIARRHGVAIIEDEALGRLHCDAPEPIAALAPDVTWYVMSTTKCLSHGLRLAYVVAPSEEAANQVLGPIEHLSYWHPAPLLAAMTTQWINSGAADQISLAIRQECVARETAASTILDGLEKASKPGSMHIWLSLPAPLRCREFTTIAERHGVLLRSSELFAVDDLPTPNAVRLSLSTPATLEEVRYGLQTLRGILANDIVSPATHA